MNLARKIVKKALFAYQHRFSGLFTSINLETYGYCNRKCNFCFNSDTFPNREVGKMDEDLYHKVIDELSEIKYAGRISNHFYGEPLMDKRTISFISYARKKCPYAFLRFSSNGDFLTEQLLIELIKNGLDLIFVTNYDDIKKDALATLAQKHPLHMIYRDFKDVTVVNRAGRIFNKTSSKENEPCNRVSRQLVINWKGDVLLCCNDYYVEHGLGNVREKSITEIWNCDLFKRYRETLSKIDGRAEIDICKNCDL